MRAFLFLFGLALLSGCAAQKVLRVNNPEGMGLTCVTEVVCVEDPAMAAQAIQLQSEASAFVQRRLGAFKTSPRVLFCSTTGCARRFGDDAFAGQNFGGLGSVINPGGWKDHIVRHELIHHWQTERYGATAVAVTLPRWFVEGMAYTISQDPRRPIPHAPSEAHRKQFQAWRAAGGDFSSPPRR